MPAGKSNNVMNTYILDKNIFKLISHVAYKYITQGNYNQLSHSDHPT